MKQHKRVTKGGKSGRRGAKSSKASARRKAGQRKGLSLMASIEEPKRARFSMADALKFYKPIKRPITLRVDADVLAWFKRDGRRYQTRINAALRKVMEREMRAER